MKEDKDDVVSLDISSILESIESGEIIVPPGLSRDERHDYVRKELFLQAEARKEKFMKEFFGFVEEKDSSLICDCPKNYGRACKKPDKYKSGGCK